MIKLFALLTVLAALPVSALAAQTSTPTEGIACKKDSQDVQYGVQHDNKQEVKEVKEAVLANG